MIFLNWEFRPQDYNSRWYIEVKESDDDIYVPISLLEHAYYHNLIIREMKIRGIPFHEVGERKRPYFKTSEDAQVAIDEIIYPISMLWKMT